jgi:hypothetical protein
MAPASRKSFGRSAYRYAETHKVFLNLIGPGLNDRLDDRAGIAAEVIDRVGTRAMLIGQRKRLMMNYLFRSERIH